MDTRKEERKKCDEMKKQASGICEPECKGKEPSMLDKAGQKMKAAGESVRDTAEEGARKVGLIKEEPSMLAKAGQKMKAAGESVRDTAEEGARKVGLLKEGEHK